MKIKSILLEIEDDNLENHKFLIRDFQHNQYDEIKIATNENVSYNDFTKQKTKSDKKYDITINLECMGYTVEELTPHSINNHDNVV